MARSAFIASSFTFILSATLFGFAVIASVSQSGFLLCQTGVKDKTQGGKDMTALSGTASAGEKNNHLHIIRWKEFQGNPNTAPQMEEAKKRFADSS